MDPAEVVLPQLLQHVRKHEQEVQGERVLWQWRMSELVHQAVLVDDISWWQYMTLYTGRCMNLITVTDRVCAFRIMAPFFSALCLLCRASNQSKL
jgi:hypothetical protein